MRPLVKHCNLFAVVLFVLFAHSCAPVQTYRPATRGTTPAAPPPAASPAPRVVPPESRPVPEQSRIKETELGTPSAGRGESPTRGPEPESPPPLPDDSSLLAKISPRTSPQRAASIRLTEEGRKFLEAEDYNRALSRLERSITIDSSNPYGYYYLAKTHYRLGRYRESLNFLEVAESSFSAEPYWLAESMALKGDNFRALGMTHRADGSYADALRLNSGNQTAIEGLNRLRDSGPPAQR